MSAQELITKHLDIWTAAHKTRSSAGRGSSNKLDLYGIKKLRELILELAVRGKLVPQDANDEPASELLKKIAAEKAKLIKEGKLKKEKPLPEITGDETPFELPISWQWTQLGDITNFGSTVKIDVISENSWVLDLEDIEKDTSKLLQKIRFNERGSLSDKNAFIKGDVLYGKLRPYLNKVIVADEDGVCTTEILPIRCYGEFDSHYFKLALKSPSFVAYVNARSYGMKMPRLGTDDGRKALIPLPPIEEQHRIVAKVDELMAFCDQLEQTQSDNIAAHAQLVEALLATLTNSTLRPFDTLRAQGERAGSVRGEPVEPHPSSASGQTEFAENWQRIAAHFDSLFTTEHSIDQLKQTILQLAVMGKLVPQDPNDEPASVLLKKIERELCQKIGQNQLLKLERDKSTIDPAEFHWRIPDSWAWCELQDIALFENGKAHEQFVTEEDKYVLINSSFVSNSGEKVKYVSERLSPLEQGDMAIVMSDVPNGRALVRCYLVEINNRYTLNQRIGCLKFSNDVSKKYLHIVLNRNKYYLSYDDGKKQTNLKKVQVLSCPIPLPSVAEQHRIVTKVDELMSLCDTLKTNLQNAQTTQLALADALVEQAVN